MAAYKGRPCSGWSRPSATRQPAVRRTLGPRKGRLERQTSGIWSLGLDEVTKILEMAAYPLAEWCGVGEALPQTPS